MSLNRPSILSCHDTILEPESPIDVTHYFPRGYPKNRIKDATTLTTINKFLVYPGSSLHDTDGTHDLEAGCDQTKKKRSQKTSNRKNRNGKQGHGFPKEPTRGELKRIENELITETRLSPQLSTNRRHWCDIPWPMEKSIGSGGSTGLASELGKRLFLVLRKRASISSISYKQKLRRVLHAAPLTEEERRTRKLLYLTIGASWDIQKIILRYLCDA